MAEIGHFPAPSLTTCCSRNFYCVKISLQCSSRGAIFLATISSITTSLPLRKSRAMNISQSLATLNFCSSQISNLRFEIWQQNFKSTIWNLAVKFQIEDLKFDSQVSNHRFETWQWNRYAISLATAIQATCLLRGTSIYYDCLWPSARWKFHC